MSTRLQRFPDWDAYAAIVAQELLAAARSGGGEVHRDRASSGHAYKLDLVEVFGSGGTIVDCRAMLPRNAAVHVNPLFLANEIVLYLTGSEYPPIWDYWPWERVKDYYSSPLHVARPYGYRVGDPSGGRLGVIIKALADHPSTKRAVVSFYDPSYVYPSEDTPCTIATQYRLRECKLETLTMFRSHDFFGGFRTDPLRISFVQQFIVACLRAQGEGVESGALHQIDGSIHWYPGKNYPHRVEDIALFPQTRPVLLNWTPFAYAYNDPVGVWDDLFRYLDIFNTDQDHLYRSRDIKDPSLRAHAETVTDAIAAAYRKYGHPPMMPAEVPA